MSTTTLSNSQTRVKEEKKGFTLPWAELHFNYFAVITFTLTVSSIIAGIAAMFVLKADAPIWQFSLVAFSAMFNNTCAIGSTPIRWVVGSFITSMIVNITMIIAYL